MKILVFGNSGSGKSTYAMALAAQHGLVHLDLDSIVWEPGKIAVQGDPQAISASLMEFLLLIQTGSLRAATGSWYSQPPVTVRSSSS